MQKDVDFVYDDLYGLTDADYLTDFESETFAYDLLGNRTSHTKRDTTVVSYDHNSANEYDKIGTPLPPSENVKHDGGKTRPKLRRGRGDADENSPSPWLRLSNPASGSTTGQPACGAVVPVPCP